MDSASTTSQTETDFLALLSKQPIPVADALALIHGTTGRDANKKADEWTAHLLQTLSEAFDFAGAYLVIKDRADLFSSTLKAAGIGDVLKRTTKDRLTSALIDAAAFGSVSLEESFRRLDLLLSLPPGSQVIDPSWGFGIVKRLDDFYKRATIDFTGKPGHTMPFSTVCDSLVRAPKDHLLTLRHADPAGTAKLAKEQPGELVKLALRSFGDMPITKLEEVLTRQGFVAASGWKSFWDSARKALKGDPLVIIPAKRADPLLLRAQAESYDDAWFTTLAATKDPAKILDAIGELEDAGKMAGLEDTQRGVMEDRLAFAIKGAFNTDAPLYAKLAVAVNRLGFLTPPVDQLRAHLWEHNRYVKASEALAVKDVAALAAFLISEGNGAPARMLGSLSDMPFSLLNETLTALKDLPETATACRSLLQQPKAPPTLVNWIFRFRKDTAWSLPPLIDLLNHAIVIVESRLSGEALRMQNNLKALFEQAKWLDGIFEELGEPQRQLLFDRIQASTAWDPSTHRSLIGRMLKLDPALTERKKSLVQQQVSDVRWTSWHSLAEHQMLYKKLVEVDLPKNSHDIAVARSYGDLRENFEYQAAKDLQRQLLQRQAEMQLELKQVKGSDFKDTPCDKVAPGTTIVLRMTADGSHRTYTILGEWDSNEALNIISNKTRLAACLEGKVAGQAVAIPAHGGEEAATIESILPLDETIRKWISARPEENA